MKKIPIWQDIKTKKYNSLTKDIKTDILIIGGGITGVSTFYALKDSKKSIVLLEKNRLGYGVTSRSTAKITLLQQDIYSRLTKNFGTKTAKIYYEMMKDAINNIVGICQKEKIACDLTKNDSYLMALHESEVEKVKEERELLEAFGEKTYDATMLPDGKKIIEGFYIQNSYVFHPLKYLSSLAEKSLKNSHQIYENTRILKLVPQKEGYIAYTEHNKIECNKVILATHYPYFLMPYLFPAKAYIEKSYIMARKGKNKNFNAINIDSPIYSCRYYKDYQIKLTGSHNLCFKENDEDNFNKLFPSNKKDYMWSNHDIITLDNLPYIGLIKDNLYIATGYNAWGMTGSSLASLVLKDLVTEKENKYASLLDPKRGMSLDSYKNLGISLFSSAYSFIKSKINLNKAWYHSNPYFTKINNKKVGIYTDDNGEKHMVYIKCPHLGCNLNFNMVENTWECPCHGSIFDIDGHSIMGPSNYDISAK